MSPTKIGPSAYLWTLLGLLALAGLSLGLSYLSLGSWETPVAMVIATLKTLLVLMVFMHLVEQGVSNKLVVVAAMAFVILLITLLGLDVVTRLHPPALPPASGPGV